MKMRWLGFDWMHFVAFMGVRFLCILWLFMGYSFYWMHFLPFMDELFYQMHFVVLYGLRFLLGAICGDFFGWANYLQKDQRREVKSS